MSPSLIPGSSRGPEWFHLLSKATHDFADGPGRKPATSPASSHHFTLCLLNRPWPTLSPQRQAHCPQDSLSLARGMIMTKSTLLQKTAPQRAQMHLARLRVPRLGSQALPAPRKSLAGESAGTQSLTNSISVAAWTPAKLPHSPGLTSCF